MSSAEKVPAAILIIFSLFVGIALVVRHYLHQKPIEGNYNPVQHM